MTADTPTLTAEERAARLIDMWRQDGVMQAGMEERDMLADAIKEAEARGAKQAREAIATELEQSIDISQMQAAYGHHPFMARFLEWFSDYLRETAGLIRKRTEGEANV